MFGTLVLLLVLALIVGILGMPLWIALLNRSIGKRRVEAVANADATYDRLFVGPTAVYEASDATIPLEDVIAAAADRGYEVTAVANSSVGFNAKTVTFRKIGSSSAGAQ